MSLFSEVETIVKGPRDNPGTQREDLDPADGFFDQLLKSMGSPLSKFGDEFWKFLVLYSQVAQGKDKKVEPDAP